MNIHNTIGIVLLILLLLGSQAQAASTLVPRISYHTAYKGGQSFIGNTWYIGAAQLSAQQGGIRGFSLRYGWGKKGEKYNVSYMIGSASLAMELGISHILQDATAPALFKGKREGQAIELGVRYGMVQITAIRSEDLFTIELGLGF